VQPYTPGVRQVPFHVAVSGLIGAGKSTLVSGLAPLLGAEALPERADENPYLDRFYEDPARWAFRSFMYFFVQSLGDEASARRRDVAAIQERVMEEHLAVFARMFRERGYLDCSDLELLSRLVRTARSLIAPSDLLVHVDISPAEALRRIRDRGRPEEQAIELDYLKALSGRYEHFVRGWSGPVLRLEAEEHDFRESSVLGELAAIVTSAALAASGG
jgi:deoxyadenosine/deoxycytidine kinase